MVFSPNAEADYDQTTLTGYIVNSVFYANHAEYRGGGIAHWTSFYDQGVHVPDLRIVNCTIGHDSTTDANEAEDGAGGVWSRYGGDGSFVITKIVNSVIVNNTDNYPSNYDELWADPVNSGTIDHSLVPDDAYFGGFTYTNCKDEGTEFINADGCDGTAVTDDDDFTLAEDADGHQDGLSNEEYPGDDRCDVDDNDNAGEPLPLDFVGYPRIETYGSIDMGAFEFPWRCLGDVDASGAVDIDDIFEILDNWGACPGGWPADCPCDLNADCEVDIDDLFVVLDSNVWGPCGSTGPSNPPQSVLDCILQYASDPEDLATCLEAIQLTGGQ